jgi:phosphotransferase system enzyme I (PtsI)
MEENDDEIVLQGVPISDGIAIGNLFYLNDVEDELIPEFSIASSEIEKEIFRYRRAINSSREDLHDLQRFLAKEEGSEEAVSIINTHIQMLDDPFITTFMEKKIRQLLRNTESVFRAVMVEYEKEFSKVKDTFFKQRLLDVKDLSERILRNLHPKKRISFHDIPDNSLIFGKELAPSNIAEASPPQIEGFITERGGKDSHAALIARSKRIPYVTNIDITPLHKEEGKTIIIDGHTGDVILNPSSKTLQHYQSLKEKRKSCTFPFTKVEEGKIATTDGCEIKVLANVESLADVGLLKEIGGKEIGLFRSEFLFFGKEFRSFSEEEQYRLYKQVLEKADGIPVTFRALDVGGDKGGVHLYDPEPNPALGCRAIRFLLQNQEVFTLQLRALLRASQMGNLQIILPLISDVKELFASKELLRNVAENLISEGYEIKEVPLGAMIEVPSAVMTCDFIVRESDFLSIGTNDLIQYTLAADRETQGGHTFYQPAHPSILRMIRRVVEECEKQNKPLSLCGEMASNPFMVPLLLGLGMRKFSCSPRNLPLICKMIRTLSLAEAEKVVQEVEVMQTSEEIEHYLKDRFQETVDGLEPFRQIF